MLHRRWLFLVWLAIVLNVLSPVLASARAAATGTLDVELCSATAPHGSTVQVAIDLQGDGSADDSTAHHGVALVWLRLVDGVALTRWDVGGAAIALTGMAVIALQPQAN